MCEAYLGNYCFNFIQTWISFVSAYALLIVQIRCAHGSYTWANKCTDAEGISQKLLHDRILWLKIINPYKISVADKTYSHLTETYESAFELWIINCSFSFLSQDSTSKTKSTPAAKKEGKSEGVSCLRVWSIEAYSQTHAHLTWISIRPSITNKD